MTNRITALICFGDSIFAGTGASNRNNGCIKILKEKSTFKVYLKGRNRDTSLKALSRIESDVIEIADASHVLILFGNNDSWLSDDGSPFITLKNFAENMAQIIGLIIKAKKIPLLCNLQPIDDANFLNTFKGYQTICNEINERPSQWQKKYSDALESLAKRLGVELVDIRTPLSDTARMISVDGIHPNDLGHRTIANLILKYVSDFHQTNREINMTSTGHHKI